MAECKACIHFVVCDRYTAPNESYPEVGGCKCFKSAADVVEVRRGHWFIVEYEFFHCSECGDSYYNGCESTKEAKEHLESGNAFQYCPNCGAKMDGKDGAGDGIF